MRGTRIMDALLNPDIGLFLHLLFPPPKGREAAGTSSILGIRTWPAECE